MTGAAQNSSSASGAVAIKDPTGLHARPAVKLTKLAKTFASEVEIRPDSKEDWANAKSPNAVMKLRAAHGELLHVRAQGPDAQASVDALVELVNNDFDG